jgi:Tol biopolymer transport system component
MRVSAKRPWHHFVALAIVVGCAVTMRAQQSPKELFERARLAEESSRNLDRAIEMYQQVVQQAPSDRALAAAAQLRIALVRERQGRPDADAAYRRVLRDFPDQQEVASAARARLASAEAAARPLQATQHLLFQQTQMSMHDMTPDGRLMVGVTGNQPTGFSIVLRDTVTGQQQVLVRDSRMSPGSSMSDDGRWVVYSWWEEKTGAEVRLIATQAGSSPTTLLTGVQQARVNVVDWAPDGRSVLVQIRKLENPARPAEFTATQLAWLSLESKGIRTIQSFQPWQAVGTAKVSPDGRYVVFAMAPHADMKDRYLYVIDADGQSLTPIVAAAGSSQSPVWTADGTGVLFVNEQGLSVISVRDGQPAGEPRAIARGFGGGLLGMTTAGSLYAIRVNGAGAHSFAVSRRIPAPDKPVVFAGFSGSWSQGDSIAYIKPTLRGVDLVDLIVRNLATGQERTYQRAGLGLQSPRWLPDGSGVVVVVNDSSESQGRAAFHMVDIKSGEFRRLFDKDTSTHVRSGVGALSPDGKTLYLTARSRSGSEAARIVAIDLATGDERVVTSFEAGSQVGLAVSPNGATLAVETSDAATNDARIFTVSVDGSARREVASEFRSGAFDMMRWTPDGRSLLFIAHDERKKWRLMRVPADGGPMEFDGLSQEALALLLPDVVLAPGITSMDVSPDGSRVILGTWRIATIEVWSMDNVAALIGAR